VLYELAQSLNDIAYELRTPVSNLLTQTQVTLSRARGADDYRRILESTAEEFERMARTIADVPLLVKSDNGLAQLKRAKRPKAPSTQRQVVGLEHQRGQPQRRMAHGPRQPARCIQ